MDESPLDAASSKERPLLLRGFAPLVVAAVLFVLMVVLAPSVAPEREVVQPGGSATTSTVVEVQP